MSSPCAYLNCNNTRAQGSKYSFFKAPNTDNELLRKIWIRHCGNSSNSIKKHIFVCEEHFGDDDVITYGTFKKLRKNSVPSPSQQSTCNCKTNYIDFCCRITAAQLLGEHKNDVNKNSKIDKEIYPAISLLENGKFIKHTFNLNFLISIFKFFLI